MPAAELAASPELRAKVAGLQAGEDPYAAAVKLAWGILLLCCETEGSVSTAGVECVKAGLDAGALGFLRSGVLDSVAMGDETEDVRLAAASVVHQLGLLFVEVANEGMAELRERSRQGGDAELQASPAGGGAEGTSMAVDQRGAGTAQPPPTPDTLATLLTTLAAALRTHPGLYLDETLRSPQLSELMGDVGQNAALINVPSVFLGYVDVLTALAATQVGARLMFQQLRPENAAQAVSWRRFFETLHAVIRQYNPPPGEGQDGAPARAPDFVLSPTDTRALCAMATLFE